MNNHCRHAWAEPEDGGRRTPLGWMRSLLASIAVVSLGFAMASCVQRDHPAAVLPTEKLPNYSINIADVTADPKEVATKLAEIGRRCWQNKFPAFEGLKLTEVKADAGRVEFKSIDSAKPKHLLVSLSGPGSSGGPGLTVALYQQDVPNAQAYIIGAVDQITRKPQPSCPKPNMAFS